jgi:hypothetical protein
LFDYLRGLLCQARRLVLRTYVRTRFTRLSASDPSAGDCGQGHHRLLCSQCWILLGRFLRAFCASCPQAVPPAALGISVGGCRPDGSASPVDRLLSLLAPRESFILSIL